MWQKGYAVKTKNHAVVAMCIGSQFFWDTVYTTQKLKSWLLTFVGCESWCVLSFRSLSAVWWRHPGVPETPWCWRHCPRDWNRTRSQSTRQKTWRQLDDW